MGRPVHAGARLEVPAVPTSPLQQTREEPSLALAPKGQVRIGTDDAGDRGIALDLLDVADEVERLSLVSGCSCSCARRNPYHLPRCAPEEVPRGRPARRAASTGRRTFKRRLGPHPVNTLDGSGRTVCRGTARGNAICRFLHPLVPVDAMCVPGEAPRLCSPPTPKNQQCPELQLPTAFVHRLSDTATAWRNSPHRMH